MTNHEDAVAGMKDTASQVLSDKSCTDAKAALDKIDVGALQSIKDSAQKLVDTNCKSGADQERIRDKKKRAMDHGEANGLNEGLKKSCTISWFVNDKNFLVN